MWYQNDGTGLQKILHNPKSPKPEYPVQAVDIPRAWTPVGTWTNKKIKWPHRWDIKRYQGKISEAKLNEIRKLANKEIKIGNEYKFKIPRDKITNFIEIINAEDVCT